ncbi:MULTISPECIES: ATP-binding protein [unclassified Streptomyces]|uniref:ATP-binding protein n=1 Tax=unclassified Streptomyces TaxID=2593676 RepID=UPI00278C665B|nr:MULTISPECIES: ATP-binding protein [unclassified Streptomyces]
MKPDSASRAREVIGVLHTKGVCAEWAFPADPSAVRGARAEVRAQLVDWGLEELADIAALLVSELVTNSLRYASGPIGVRVACPYEPSGVLLVEVSDPLPDPPCARAATPDDEGGRGLQLVAEASRRWGTRPGRERAGGKTVWFELALPG